MSDEKKPFDFDMPQPAATPKPSLRRPTPAAEEDTDTALGNRLLSQARATGAITTEVTAPPAEDDDEWKSRTVPMPARVSRAIDVRGGREKKTMKYYVLLGLQMQGFPVKDEDLQDRRGSALKEMAARRRAEKENG